ncbi:MAG: endonuclease/exonuclease/phosphatase family protein [Pseudonocardiaceae bacterium]
MTSPHQDPADELRILHWNIHSWCDDAGASNLESVVNLVRTTNPHVVSLVEVDTSWGHPSSLDEVANRCGYSSIFVPAFEYGKDSPTGGFGNTLLSKLPILAIRQRQLVWPLRLYDGSEPSEQRTVVFAKLQTTAEPVWIGSTHLPRSEADTRMDVAHRLAAMTQELTAQWLLFGDFNMPASAWLDVYPFLAAYPMLAQPTYPTKNPVETIDYCVAPQNLSVKAEVLPEVGSDHFPVLVSCRIK